MMTGSPARFRRYLDPLNYLRFPERALLWRDWRASTPQVFILGLPRSGTTLVYQYIVHRLQVAYFTNGVGAYPHAPVLTTWWQHRRSGPYRSDFRSQYGKVQGAAAPREAGGFWNRFFDQDAYTRFDELSAADVRTLRRTVAAVQRIFDDAPFVNKNVKHMLRLDALAQLYPRAVFLIVERDPTDVALSLLRARHTLLSDPGQWWSVRPPDYARLKNLPVVDQIAGQVHSLQRQLAHDLAALPASRLLTVAYESFCAEPETLTAQLVSRVGPIAPRNPPVASFPISHSTPATDDEAQLVHRLAEEGSK